jgi:hypothetical protein
MRLDPEHDGAVCTPYVEGYDDEGEPIIRWEWDKCPDCGHPGAHHHDENGRQGVRCG